MQQHLSLHLSSQRANTTMQPLATLVGLTIVPMDSPSELSSQHPTTAQQGQASSQTFHSACSLRPA